MAKKELGLIECQCGAQSMVMDDGRKCWTVCEACGEQRTWQRKQARERIRAHFASVEVDEVVESDDLPNEDVTDEPVEPITDDADDVTDEPTTGATDAPTDKQTDATDDNGIIGRLFNRGKNHE